VETQHSQEKLDTLLREANVFRLRGQVAEAEERCRAVLEQAPEEPTALEMLADLLRGRGKLEEAADLYRRAVAAAPDRPSPEKKLAEIALELAERERLRDAAAVLLANPTPAAQQRRNVVWAFMLSSVFPGMGQLYNRELVKGGLLMVGTLLCLALGGDALLRMMFTEARARASGTVSPYGAWAGFLGFVLWLYAVIDAVVVAQKRGAGPAG
jgi:tetratricopeptide (TPR) repeat protein